MERNKPSKCLITKLKIYSHRPSDWLISILFFFHRGQHIVTFPYWTFDLCSHKPSNCLIYVLNIYSHKTFTSDCPICILNICSNRTPDRHIIIVNICSSRPTDCLISILNRSSQKRLVIFTKTLPSKSTLWWITNPHSRIRENLSSLLSMVSLGRSKSHL